MARLTIYDSQGQPVGDSTAGKNQRVADFFFDGVRLAIENMDRTTVYCFFRARESEGARADQFYAEYETSSIREVGNLTAEVERVAREEHGMVMDTSTEDATVFDLIEEASSLRAPGDRSVYNALPKLMNRGERLRFGTSGYRDALGALYEIATGGGRVNRIAIADNAESSQLSDYDVVIETGDYTGLEPIGDTEQILQKAKKRGRGSRSGGGAGGSGPPGGGGGYDLGGGSTDDDLTLLDQVKVFGLILGVVTAVLLVIVLVSCTAFGFDFGFMQGVPVVGGACGGGGVSANFEFSVADGNQQLVLSWTKNEGNTNITVVLSQGPRIRNTTGEMTISNETGSKTLVGTPGCNCSEVLSVPQRPETYNVTVHVDGSTQATTRVRVTQNSITTVGGNQSTATRTQTTTTTTQTSTATPNSTLTAPTPSATPDTGSTGTTTTTTSTSTPTSSERAVFDVSADPGNNSVLVRWSGVQFTTDGVTRRMRLSYEPLVQADPANNTTSIGQPRGSFRDRLANPIERYRVIVELSEPTPSGRVFNVVRNTTINFNT